MTLLYDDLLKAQAFFKEKGWWSSYTSERQHLYKIVVDDIQGYNNASATADKIKKILDGLRASSKQKKVLKSCIRITVSRSMKC